jgi:arylsulfatase
MRGDYKAVRLNVRREGFEAPLELYNLAEDQGETTDIAADHPDICTELAGLMNLARTPSQEFPFGPREH